MTKKDDIGFILGSKPRFKILIALRENASTPTAISYEIEETIFRTSTVLKELTDTGYIHCINPKAKRGRLYSLTEKGKNIIRKINELTGGE